jgi:hypothetical protein
MFEGEENMNKKILIILVCVNLLLITPFTVVAQENKISSNITEQPNIKGLVTNLRVIVKEILQKHGHNSIVSYLCNRTIDSLCIVGFILGLMFFWYSFLFLFWFIVGIIMGEPDYP